MGVFYKKKTLFILVVVLVVLNGCGASERLSEPVGKFRIATKGAAEVTRPYLIQLNEVERRYKFNEAYVEPTIEIDATFLTPTFAPEGIAARLECFAIIDIYTTRLAEIADSKVTEKLRTNTNALGTNLDDLFARIGTIKGDSTIQSYAGPVSALVGFVAEIWIDSQRNKALKIATQKAAPQVNKILNLLEADLRKAHHGRAEAVLTEYVDLVEKYNADRDTLGDKARKARLDELEMLANQYELLESNPPQDVIRTMREAHESMVKAAGDIGNEVTFGEFVAAVEILAMQVQQAQVMLGTVLKVQ